MSEGNKIKLLNCFNIQWIGFVLFLLCLLSALVLTILKSTNILDLSDYSYIGLYFTSLMIICGVVRESYFNENGILWNGYYNRRVVKALSEYESFDVEKEIDNTVIINGTVFLISFCFVLGFFLESSHVFLSIFVPVLSSVFVSVFYNNGKMSNIDKFVLVILILSSIWFYYHGYGVDDAVNSSPYGYLIGFLLWVYGGALGGYFLSMYIYLAKRSRRLVQS